MSAIPTIIWIVGGFVALNVVFLAIRLIAYQRYLARQRKAQRVHTGDIGRKWILKQLTPTEKEAIMDEFETHLATARGLQAASYNTSILLRHYEQARQRFIDN